MKKILSYGLSAVLLWFIIKRILKLIGGVFGVVTSLIILIGAIYLLSIVTKNLD